MIVLLCFVLALLASPFKSKSRLEAENASLRYKLMVLRRKVHGCVRFTNNDRLFLILFAVSSAIAFLSVTAAAEFNSVVTFPQT